MIPKITTHMYMTMFHSCLAFVNNKTISADGSIHHLNYHLTNLQPKKLKE